MSAERQFQNIIFVKSDFVGWHRWKDAPEHLSYLRHPHRHTFYVTVEVIVDHSDRAIEFHEFKRDVKGSIGLVCNQMQRFAPEEACSTMSCEQIGEAIIKLTTDYKITKVTVSEDGECGSITCPY